MCLAMQTGLTSGCREGLVEQEGIRSPFPFRQDSSQSRSQGRIRVWAWAVRLRVQSGHIRPLFPPWTLDPGCFELVFSGFQPPRNRATGG